MATNLEYFRTWHVNILSMLYPIRDAGFAIVMLAFPLLERYLRGKVGIPAQGTLIPAFYDELVSLFPKLKDRETARHFWQVFRNGLLHEVTMSGQDRTGKQMPQGSLTHDVPGLLIEPDGSFLLNPVDFAKQVVQIIESDFSTYEKDHFVGTLPFVKTHTQGNEYSTVHLPLTSTNTSPNR